MKKFPNGSEGYYFKGKIYITLPFEDASSPDKVMCYVRDDVRIEHDIITKMEVDKQFLIEMDNEDDSR